MRRREFITLLGGAAALPLAARAQQPAVRVYRIGYLTIASREQQLHLIKAFEEGLLPPSSTASPTARWNGCPHLPQTWFGSAWTSSLPETLRIRLRP